MATPTEKDPMDNPLDKTVKVFSWACADQRRSVAGEFVRLEEYKALERQALQLRKELHVKTIGEQAVWDDRDRLEGELARTEYGRAKGAHMNGLLLAQRDEARVIAGGLLRLARAWEPGIYADTWDRVNAALAALPPAVRRLIQGG